MNLHIGGKERRDGWKILNVQAGPAVDFVGDIRDLSEFGDDSIENLYASHVLEHVAQAEVVPVLRGVYRTMKRGGKFLVSVPDLDTLCQLYINPSAPPQVKWHAMRMMFGGQIDAYDFHFVGFNEYFLSTFLTESGFSHVLRVESLGMFDDTSEFKPYGIPISLNLIATK